MTRKWRLVKLFPGSFFVCWSFTLNGGRMGGSEGERNAIISFVLVHIKLIARSNRRIRSSKNFRLRVEVTGQSLLRLSPLSLFFFPIKFNDSKYSNKVKKSRRDGREIVETEVWIGKKWEKRKRNERRKKRTKKSSSHLRIPNFVLLWHRVYR